MDRGMGGHLPTSLLRQGFTLALLRIIYLWHSFPYPPFPTALQSVLKVPSGRRWSPKTVLEYTFQGTVLEYSFGRGIGRGIGRATTAQCPVLPAPYCSGQGGEQALAQ